VRSLSWTPFSPPLKRQNSIIILASPTQNSEAPDMLTDPYLPTLKNSTVIPRVWIITP
jgi:hypothetical protein